MLVMKRFAASPGAAARRRRPLGARQIERQTSRLEVSELSTDPRLRKQSGRQATAMDGAVWCPAAALMQGIRCRLSHPKQQDSNLAYQIAALAPCSVAVGNDPWRASEGLHLTTKEWPMQKCLRPQSSLLTSPTKRSGFGVRQLTDWLMRLLWRLKPFHPPSIA